MIPHINDFEKSVRDLVNGSGHASKSKYRIALWFKSADPELHNLVVERLKSSWGEHMTISLNEHDPPDRMIKKWCNEANDVIMVPNPSNEYFSRVWCDFSIDESKERSVYNRPTKLDEQGNRLCQGCRGPIPIRYNKNGEKSKIQRTWCTEDCWRTYAFPRTFVWNRDKGICQMCLRQCEDRGDTVDGWDLDHIIPVIEGGGALGPENWRTLCRLTCHKRATAELAARRADQRKAEKKVNKKKWGSRKIPSRPFEKRPQNR